MTDEIKAVEQAEVKLLQDKEGWYAGTRDQTGWKFGPARPTPIEAVKALFAEVLFPGKKIEESLSAIMSPGYQKLKDLEKEGHDGHDEQDETRRPD